MASGRSRIFILRVQTLLGNLVSRETGDFHVDFKRGPTIFIEFFEARCSLMGTTTPA